MSWKRIGQIKESKAGNLYMSFEEEVTLNKDTNVILQDPRDFVDRELESGKIDEEEANAKRSKIPSFVLYNLVLPHRN